MKKIEESAEAIAGVNISPVINVAFVLVIVMMMTTPILNIPNIPVNLPEALTAETKESNVTVSVAMDGKVSVDQEMVTWEDLPRKVNARLKEEKNLIVLIRADKDIVYSRVEDLMDLLKSKTRAKRIAIATRQRSQSLRK